MTNEVESTGSAVAPQTNHRTSSFTVTKREYIELARFRNTIRHFLRFSELQAREAGLTPQQHQMLLAVKGIPNRDWATIGEISDHLQINHNAAVGLAQRAEASGLVTRTTSPEDRRIVQVALTEKGEAILAELSALHKQELERIGPVFSDLLSTIVFKPGQ